MPLLLAIRNEAGAITGSDVAEAEAIVERNNAAMGRKVMWIFILVFYVFVCCVQRDLSVPSGTSRTKHRHGDSNLKPPTIKIILASCSNLGHNIKASIYSATITTRSLLSHEKQFSNILDSCADSSREAKLNYSE